MLDAIHIHALYGNWVGLQKQVDWKWVSKIIYRKKQQMKKCTPWNFFVGF